MGTFPFESNPSVHQLLLHLNIEALDGWCIPRYCTVQSSSSGSLRDRNTLHTIGVVVLVIIISSKFHYPECVCLLPGTLQDFQFTLVFHSLRSSSAFVCNRHAMNSVTCFCVQHLMVNLIGMSPFSSFRSFLKKKKSFMTKYKVCFCEYCSTKYISACYDVASSLPPQPPAHSSQCLSSYTLSHHFFPILNWSFSCPQIQ